MGELISDSQKAFMEGRQVLHVALIANEAIDTRLMSCRGGIVCKLDIDKACDHEN